MVLQLSFKSVQNSQKRFTGPWNEYFVQSFVGNSVDGCHPSQETEVVWSMKLTDINVRKRRLGHHCWCHRGCSNVLTCVSAQNELEGIVNIIVKWQWATVGRSSEMTLRTKYLCLSAACLWRPLTHHHNQQQQHPHPDSTTSLWLWYPSAAKHMQQAYASAKLCSIQKPSKTTNMLLRIKYSQPSTVHPQC